MQRLLVSMVLQEWLAFNILTALWSALLRTTPQKNRVNYLNLDRPTRLL